MRESQTERNILNAYFAANEVKISGITLEVVSFNWMSFSALSLMSSAPSF